MKYKNELESMRFFSKLIDGSYPSWVHTFENLVNNSIPMKPILVEEEIGGEDRESIYIKMYTCPVCYEHVYFDRCCQNNKCRQCLDWSKK